MELHTADMLPALQFTFIPDLSFGWSRISLDGQRIERRHDIIPNDDVSKALHSCFERKHRELPVKSQFANPPAVCVTEKQKTDLSQQSPKSNRSREMAKQITIRSAAIFSIKRYHARIARQMTANEFTNWFSRPEVCLFAASDNQSVAKNVWKGDQLSTNCWKTGITYQSAAAVCTADRGPDHECLTKASLVRFVFNPRSA